MFELLAQDGQSKARRGRLTPAFMPVGMQGSVKPMSPHKLRELDAPIVLGNTYHLFVRSRLDVIKHFCEAAQADFSRAGSARLRRIN